MDVFGAIELAQSTIESNNLESSEILEINDNLNLYLCGLLSYNDFHRQLVEIVNK